MLYILCVFVKLVVRICKVYNLLALYPFFNVLCIYFMFLLLFGSTRWSFFARDPGWEGDRESVVILVGGGSRGGGFLGRRPKNVRFPYFCGTGLLPLGRE